MSEPRLKSEILVAAVVRRAQSAGAFAAVVRRGDNDAGAIALKVFLGAGCARLFVQSRNDEGEAIWREPFDGVVDEARIDDYLAKEQRFDSDLWIVEIEDREGRSFLD